jgi:hypothetical protein
MTPARSDEHLDDQGRWKRRLQQSATATSIARTQETTMPPSKQPKAVEPEEDVEGHSMLPIDPSSARHLSRAREDDIRRHLSKHDLESDAKRPHKRDR